MKPVLLSQYATQLVGFSVSWQPDASPEPKMLFWNATLAQSLGLDQITEQERFQVFSGQSVWENSQPVAQVYAGHQFGGFSPKLGDGRALLLGEIQDSKGDIWDLAFKGSGKTPFSRGGDGKAAVGPMVREAIISEAMYGLGIPTSRALAVVQTGEMVRREVTLPGALLTRVAASHIRVGTFEFFATRGELDRVRQLADFAIARHYPDLLTEAVDRRYEQFVRSVASRQAKLIAQWMLTGFVHGVMNTDNMTISGETIDYGPCAFLEAYRPDSVFSSIDTYGRYAYANQPVVARWNLARLCESMLPLLHESQEQALVLAHAILDDFLPECEGHLRQGRYLRLGWDPALCGDREAKILEEWLELLTTHAVDHTLAWRRLAEAAEGQIGPLQALFPDPNAVATWLAQWAWVCTQQDGAREATTAGQQRAILIRKRSPIYIARNHLVEEALSAASRDGNMEPTQKLLERLQRPFEELEGQDRYAMPAPTEFTQSYRTFCGT